MLSVLAVALLLAEPAEDPASPYEPAGWGRRFAGPKTAAILDKATRIEVFRIVSHDQDSEWRKAKKPAAWDSVQQALNKGTDPMLRDRLRELSAVFGDGRALDEVRRIALDGKAPLNARAAALGLSFGSS